MGIALITGSGGLIGSEAVRYLARHGFTPIGIDNDMRCLFFGQEASTTWNVAKIKIDIHDYTHYEADIRDKLAMGRIFQEYGSDIRIIIHTAAQPSHDWAATDPLTDFTVNGLGTLVLLEMMRQHCPDAVFIFTSTNKVYGDSPNSLPLIELENRWDIDHSHPCHKNGIDESMSIDYTKHSVFGASKVAADIMVQEYGRYFELKTGRFRCGCLSGSNHSSTKMHGFLSYLMKCTITGEHYTVFGYKGKQVRDNIHSYDLINMFCEFYKNPRPGEVYNVGGGRHSNCSILEAIEMSQSITGRTLDWSYDVTHRTGDHIWWISDVSKFQSHYPNWKFTYDVMGILKEIYEGVAIGCLTIVSLLNSTIKACNVAAIWG